ncbi:MAG: Transcriptional regulator, LysR family [Herminiimonas sp.]|nr:Transcriptional regulator, LysR family [Herminiimonas sp.]
MIDSRIKLRHLQCFLVVAQQRSIQKASAALSITQPAVSKTIRELEDILKVRLLDRDRKGAVLTRYGEIFFDYAQTSLNALQQATNSISQARSFANEIIKIGASPSLTASFFPQVLLAFHQRAGNLQIALLNGTTAHLMAQLRERALDFVLCRHSDPEQMVGLAFEYLYADPLVVVVRPGHPLLEESVVKPESLRLFPAVLPIKGSVNRHAADAFAATHNIGPAAHFIENLSVSFGRVYTTTSDAVWFVSWSAVKVDVENRVLVKLPLPMKESEKSAGLMVRSIGLMMRTNSVPAPAAQILINIIREAAAERRAEVL